MIFFELIFNLDTHIAGFLSEYGLWTYLILFIIIFLETGLVVTPFLPGDSLLFIAGSFAATQALDLKTLIILLSAAAIIGDTINYWIGTVVGPRVFKKENSRFFNKKYLKMTQDFFERHGGKAIILARFFPIIRTFAPFVAGMGKMNYKRFLAYNVIGAILWVGLFSIGGYIFGNVPIIKDNISLVALLIIIVSLLPAVVRITRKSIQ